MSNLRLSMGQQLRVVLFSVALLSLAACGEKPQPASGGMKVPVSVVTVQPARTEVFVDLPGRVAAIKDAEIRARVTGIVTEINFKQGSDVKEGQLLFTIDPAPYQAARAQVAATLKKAQADAQSVRLLAQRYAKLIKVNAVSRQEYDTAVAQSAQAEAAIAGAKAALQSADIDLAYTKVASPINGRIGKSLVTEGALVSASSATQMATVQQLDRVYVDLTRSTAQLSQLRRALASGELTQAGEGAATVQVVLEDGTLYDEVGTLLFSGVTVDPATGQVNLRAEVPNPGEILLPGMYVRVRLQQGVDEKALLVPQQAIQRTADGLNSLVVVRDGKAQTIAVVLGAEVKGQSIVYKGLNPGDVVVVEGFQKIRPGAPVQAIPWKEKAAREQSPGASSARRPTSSSSEPAAKPAGQPDPKSPASESASRG